MFFDVTSIRFYQKRLKQWNYPVYETGRFYKRDIKYTHVLMIVRMSKVIAVQFVQESVTTVIIFNFLREVLCKLQGDATEQEYHIVLDNDTKHKTSLIKSLCVAHKAHFHFIVPHNPYFNIIEYVFRFAKGSLYNDHTKTGSDN